MSTTPADPAAGEVLETVHRLMHSYRTLQYRFLRDGPFAITHMDGIVLMYFSSHPASTQGELVQAVGRDKAQMARLVKGLRARGLLTAQPNSEDRRSARLSLSAEGRRVHAALRRQATRLSARAVATLSAAERIQLVGLLQRVHRNLDE